MQTKKRPTRASAQMKTIYRRRQIVALLVLLVALAAVISLAWATVKSVSAVGHAVYDYLRRDQLTALNKQAVPSTVMSSGIADCDGTELTLSLKAVHPSVASGAALQFVATIAHKGMTACLVDGSDSSRVLTISSGGQKVWSSALCPVPARELLMTDTQQDIQTLTWDTAASGTDCKGTAPAPAAAGTYQAQLSIKGIAGLTSQPVTFQVETAPAGSGSGAAAGGAASNGDGTGSAGSDTSGNAASGASGTAKGTG